ncbi:MAG: efflux RND transporter permease subunit, partial [Alistipes sp.]|nr:efflux RND transporter permease subunit [Alistipes sp.]
MSLSEFSLRRSSVVYFVLMLFVVGGIWSFIRMGKKEDSTFVLKSAVVTCDYAGATPFEVEQLISEPVSRELQSMRRIKKITSESYYGHARIMVELESGVRAREIPQLWDELRRKVENISSSLPAAAGPLRVDDDISDVYGLYYALAADEGFSWDEIRSWAQQLKREIVAIDGVQKVALKGEQQPVVNIYITKSTLANFSISPEMIAATLSQQNNIVDTGEIDASQVRVRILEPGTYSTIEDIADQLLIAPDGRQFRLGDITRIKQGYVDPPTVVMKVDGRRAVGIGVASDGDADVVRLGGEVEALLTHFESQMPVGMDILTLYPEDQIARRANLSFMLNLLESVAIVIVVIMLSMGFRAGSLIGLSLIFTIGGTMLCMYGLGEGINRTSLAGFIIAMGMLVDNAIVVVDNAIRGVGRNLTMREALLQGADRPKWGLLGATLIAVFSFLPLYLAPSSVAEIVKPLFIVIALSLLLSWLLALTQVPLFGMDMLREGTMPVAQTQAWFKRVLMALLAHRWSVVVVVVLLFAGAVVAMKRMPQNFFPQLDKPYFRADVILPEGYDMESTAQHLDAMTEWLLSQQEVVRVSTTAGATPLRYYLASGSVASRPNFGNLLVEVRSSRVTEQVKQRFDDYVEASFPDVWLRS